MRGSRTKKIGEFSYEVGCLAPTPALDLLMDLSKMIGPALAPVFDRVGNIGSLMDRDLSSLKSDFIGAALKELLTSLNKDTVTKAIKLLSSVTLVHGRGKLDAVYEVHFAETGLAAMIEWLPFALSVQYDDFFAFVRNDSASNAPTVSAGTHKAA